nr:hypothetical protein [uncultured Olsenella sp.]
MAKATDGQIRESYARLKNVWKVAEELGMCGQSVHERLKRMGVDTSANQFTKDDERYLAERYLMYRDAGQLQILADEMGRTKQFICRKAGTLGLTDPKHARSYARTWAQVSEAVLAPLWDQFKRSRKGVGAFCRSRHYNVQSFTDAMRRCFPDEYDTVIESKRPRRTQYARGRDFEYAVRDDLAKRGYLVLRSPASKSPADLYAIRTGELVFVQCKLHGAIGVEEWNAFLGYCESVSATPVIAQRGEGDRGIAYDLVTGRKTGSRGDRQPMVPWHPAGVWFRAEEIEGDAL